MNNFTLIIPKHPRAVLQNRQSLKPLAIFWQRFSWGQWILSRGFLSMDIQNQDFLCGLITNLIDENDKKDTYLYKMIFARYCRLIKLNHHQTMGSKLYFSQQVLPLLLSTDCLHVTGQYYSNYKQNPECFLIFLIFLYIFSFFFYSAKVFVIVHS